MTDARPGDAPNDSGDRDRPRRGAEPERPLPPLPDGGLAAAMPEWLRAAPGQAPPVGGAAVPPVAGPAAPTDELADILTVDDLPPWLRELAAGSSQTAARRSAPERRAHPAANPAAPRSHPDLPPETGVSASPGVVAAATAPPGGRRSAAAATPATTPSAVPPRTPTGAEPAPAPAPIDRLPPVGPTGPSPDPARSPAGRLLVPLLLVLLLVAVVALIYALGAGLL